MKYSKGRDLGLLFHCASPGALDLIKKTLQTDPNKRFSVTDGITHHYLKKMRNPAKETSCKKFSTAFEKHFEYKINSPFGVRHMMYEELKKFKRTKEIEHQCSMPVACVG